MVSGPGTTEHSETRPPHPWKPRRVDNVARIRDAFRAFAERDSITVGRLIGNGVVWRVPGQSAMAGEYRGRAEIFEFLRRTAELTGGTYRTDVVDVWGGDELVVASIARSAAARGASSISRRPWSSASRARSCGRCWRCRVTRRRSTPSGAKRPLPRTVRFGRGARGTVIESRRPIGGPSPPIAASTTPKPVEVTR